MRQRTFAELHANMTPRYWLMIMRPTMTALEMDLTDLQTQAQAGLRQWRQQLRDFQANLLLSILRGVVSLVI